MSRRRRVHCWMDKHAWAEEQYGWGSEQHVAIFNEPNATCMAWEGHEGEHEWVPDDQITVAFK